MLPALALGGLSAAGSLISGLGAARASKRQTNIQIWEARRAEELNDARMKEVNATRERLGREMLTIPETRSQRLYNMTAPSVITGTPQQVVVDFPSGSYGGLYRTDASEPFHPTGVYQMACQLSAPLAGNPTRNGPNLGANTQVLWYIVQKIAASAWSHSWAYTYEQAVQGEQITFPSNVSVTTTSRVRMFGNLVRRFGVNAEQPYNMLETKIQQVSDNIKQSEYDKVHEWSIRLWSVD